MMIYLSFKIAHSFLSTIHAIYRGQHDNLLYHKFGEARHIAHAQHKKKFIHLVFTICSSCIKIEHLLFGNEQFRKAEI